MKYEDYKHALLKPETHKKLKMLCAEDGFRSFDEAINNLLEDSKK